MLNQQQHNLGLRFGTSKMHLSPPPAAVAKAAGGFIDVDPLLIVAPMVCGGGGEGCIWSLFCYSVLCVLLVLQSPLWGKELVAFLV